MATQAATVSVLQGKAWARAEDGSLRELAAGDVIAADEHLVTESGTRIELDFGDGAPAALNGLHDVAMSPDLWPETATSSEQASVFDDQFDAILASLDENDSLLQGSNEERFDAILSSLDANDNLLQSDNGERIDTILASLDENDSLLLGGEGDLLDILDEAPAAGQAGSDGGHSFVRVERINESVDGQSYQYDNGSRATAPSREESDFAANNAPTTTDQSLTTDEDTPILGQISAQDLDGDSLSYTLTQPPANGSVTLNTATGEFEYTPNTDFNGADEFTVTVSDGIQSTVSVAQVEVLPVNDAPVAQDQVLSTPEDVPLSGQVDASDVDLDDTLTYTLGVPPGNGTVTIDPATGGFTYTPAENYNGPDSFDVIVTDSAGATDTATVQLTVTPVNDAPDAVDDGPLETFTATTVTGNALDNDSDIDGDNLQVISFNIDGDDTVFTPGDEIQLNNAGVFGIDGNGEFYFTPNADYSGPVPSVSYTVSDGSLTDSAIISFDDVPGGANPAPPVEPPEANDNPVVLIDNDSDANSVSESASNGATVGVTGLGTDADSGTSVSYTLADDAGGRFAIDASTGVVTVADASGLDYESASSHDIQITATSSDGSVTTETFTINVTNANDNPVVLIDNDSDANSVSESASNGATVGVTGLGTDADSGTSVSYTLADDAGGRFAIDASTGVVTVADASGLDYESASSHDIQITATSSDGSVTTETFTINVTNANDNPVVLIDNDSDANSVSESASNGATVGVTGLGTDADSGTSVSYTLADDAGGRFAIDASTGVVTVADASGLDYESASSHDIQITATSSDGSVTTETFTINVTNANDNPVVLIDNDSDANSVSESASNGATVGVTGLGTDADSGTSVSYTLADDAGGRFAIDASTGVVTVADASGLDYESASSHDIQITATSSDGSVTTETFTINVTNANDNPVVLIDNDSDANSVSESASNGATVGVTGLGTDADSGTSVSYTLADDAGGRFAIDASTGVVTVADASGLDYESASSHDIQITATSSDGSVTTETFTINVTNANDNPVVLIDNDSDANSVSESASNGATVGVTGLGTDADSGTSVSYTLADDAGGRFAIDASTGVVTVADASGLDYESASSHDIQITATSSDGSVTTETFTINVTNANDNPVVLIDNDSDANSVSESASNGATVGVTGLGTDADSGTSVSYTLADDAGGRFAIDASTGVVTVADASGLDYESASSHDIQITATSSDGSVTTETFTINVTNANDNPVVLIDNDSDANSVSESASNGATVGVTGLGTDADSGTSVSYTLADDAGGRFAIDASTGVVTVADASGLDYESASSHDIQITATSSDGSVTTETFTINVTNANDNPVVLIDNDSDANSVSESASNGATVGVTGLGTDADSGTSVSYTLADDAGGRFAIDASTGVVTVADASGLDYESASSHDIQITATSSDGSVTTETFTINVTNANDNPVVLIDNDSDANSVSESASNGATVGVTGLGTDADSGTSVSYTLADDAGGRFAIDASTGVVTVADASGLDYESASSHDIQITATSSDGSVTTETFTINVTNANDNPVVLIDNDSDANSVSESASNGATVGVTGLGTDADSGTSVSYTLADDAGGRFAIDASTGVVTVADASGLDYESASSHDIQITATSSDGSVTTETFTINVTNANDNPVVLIDNDSDANSVSESASNGATVGVTGLGTDADSGTSVSYTLADDAGGRFAIDASTGVVTVADASGLDYESASSHDIQITATSSDGSVTTETFTINVTNANDNPVVLIDNDSDANSVSESASNGATVGVTGLGTDADSGTSVSYTLADDAGGRFAIDASTGVVTVADASGLDYESASSHDIQITATSSDGSVTTETFTINVTNANDNPVVLIDNDSDANSVSESASNGATVGVTGLGTDADSGTSVSYTLADDAGGRFAIDASTGVVTVADASGLDYESASSHDIQITATSSDGSVTTETFTINVTNANDNPVVLIDNDSDANSVSESASNGATVGVTGLGTDADSGTSVSYTLADDAGGRFAIDASTGVVTVADASGLDYESASSHDIQITATSSDGSVTTETFTINVTNANDNPVVLIDNDSDANSVSESASNGATVGVTGLGTDADSGTSVSYTLADDAGGRFAIDASTGVVTVADASGLDYESASSHDIQITATSSDGSVTTETFTINVTNANDNPVVLIDNDSDANSVSESASNGATVGVTGLGTDADSGTSVSYTLADDAGGRFAIDASTGVVTVADASGLDYESASSHDIQITATSSDGSVTTETFTINVTNANDNPVVLIDNDSDANSVSESASNGATVGVTGLGTDADSGTSVSYTLADDAGGRFAIDASTGVVTVADASGLDYESASSHDIQITATSSDGSVTTETFTINVTNANDNPVVLIDNDSDANSVSESASNGATVGVTGLGTDADSGTSVSYTLADDAGGRFAIDASTGVVTVADASGLDYESASSHDIQITATSSDGSVTTETFTINVTNANDNPVVLIDNDSDANSVSESASNGATVGVTGLGTDADSGTSVSYTLADDAGGRFAIDASTGVVTVADASGLDYESASSHDIQITATSSDGSVTTETFTINVTNANDNPVVLIDNDSDANSVSESASNGATVGVTGLGTDADSGTSVSYTLADDAGGRFAIDASTGVVTVADASGLDYESASSHDIQITATSSDGSVTTETFTINVTNANDNPVVLIDNDSDANSVSESASNGATVGVTGLGTDADSGTSVSYTLADDAGGRFAIDASTGVVTVADASGLDYESASSHDIQITATSSDGSVTTETFTINVTNANDNPVVLIDNDSDANSVSESASNGATVGVTGLGTDADSGTSVSYTLADDAGGRFAIDASTGVVTVADASGLDYESASSHDIQITATSSDGSVTTETFTINVTNANDNPVVLIDNDSDANSVSESASNGATVGVTGLGTDADSGTSVSYTLADDAGGRFAIDASTGVVTVADASGLDYESASSHDIQITATSSDGSVTTETFTINVTNANDNPVVLIDNDSDANSVSESASNGATVGVTGLGTDADSGTSVSYTLADDAGGRFAIDASTGVVTVADASGLDYESASSHDIQITATSSDGSVTTETFTINVTNANDNPVVLIDNDSDANSVSESASNGATVGVTGLGTDADSGTSVSYTLADDAGGRFAIDASTGVVTVADASGLDYESASSHDIQITATSSDGSVTTETFTINVTNANDNPVVLIDNDSDANSVSESASNGATVGVTGLGTDADSGTSVSYTLADDAGGRFAIDASTGVVTVADASGLDYESASSHDIQITATSSDGSVTTETFTINVTNANDNPVVLIDNDSDANSVSESASNGATVGVTGLGTDADSGTSVSYTLADDAGGRFAIDASTGVVTVADASGLDYESASSHDIQITATSSDGSVTTETFTINVTNANDNPVVLIDNDSDANSVSESASNGATVGVTGLGTDADSGTSVSYTLADDAGGRFAIDASTGVVTVADASGLDYESASSHDIQITATSSDGSVTTETFTINVTNANDNPVVLIDNDSDANSVSESASNGATVGVTGLGTDADSGTSVSYTLADDAGGRFAIDASTGVVTVADASGLDYESASSHDIQITATSSDGSVTTETFTINVTNANDNPVVLIDNDSDANSVSESASNGATVGVTGLGTDADSGTSVSYTLADDAGGRFAIDASTGVVTVADASGLDYESASSHDIQITATSSDGSVTTETFTINVTNANDNPVANSDDLLDGNEDTTSAVLNSDMLSNDTDLDGDMLSITHINGTALTGGVQSITVTNGTVNVDSTGNITFTPALNYVGDVSFEYTVSDSNGGSDSAIVGGTIVNVNDAPVAVDDTVLTSENTPITLTVADIVTPNDTDEDGDTLTISGVGNAANGSVVLNGDGSVTFTPDTDFTGEATFDYTVNDGNGGTDTATVRVNVPGLRDNAGEVYEEALSTGSNSSSNAETTSGNLLSDDLALPSGALSLSVSIVGGTVNNSVMGQTVVTTAEGNVLIVNTDNTDAGFGDYTYTLLNPIDHNLIQQDFTLGAEGWSGSGVSQQLGQLRIARDSTATQTFSFGSEMAGKQVVLSFDLNVSGGWDTSGGSRDYFNVSANGDLVNSSSPADASTSRISTTLTLDGNGEAVITLNADTTANSEIANIDNLSITAVNLTDQFTYTLDDGAGFVESANLNVAIYDDLADTPRDYDESTTFTEDQDLSVGTFNLLDNATPQSGSSISSVSNLTLFVNGADAAADFTITSGSAGSGEAARYSFIHNDTFASAELVVYDNGDVTWENGYENLFDFMSPGDMAQLQISYVTSVGGTSDSSIATLNISGVNDGPTAVTDSGLTSGGFASEFWVYNEGEDGPNLESVAQVIGFTGSNTPDATFISTGLSYSVVSGDSDYRANLGSNNHLEDWLADGGDEGSVVRNTTESSGDAIVRFAGVFEVETAGQFTLDITHDDGFIVFIDGVETFTADFITSPSNFVQTTNLSAGSHDVEIYYWDQGGEYVFDGSLYDSSNNDLWTPANLSYRGAPISTEEDEAVTVDVLANDWDIEGDSLTVIGVTNGANGTASTNGSTVVYTPNAGFFGLDSFTYTISDGNGGTDSVSVSVEVRPENNAALIDLDGDDSSGKSGSDYFAAAPLWNPVAVVDSDVSITDIDGSSLFSAKIEILNPMAGDELVVSGGSLPSNIGFSYNEISGVGLLSGFASLAEYQSALQLIHLDNNDSSVTGDRSIEISVNDGNDQSMVATSTIRVTNNEQSGDTTDNEIDASWATADSITLHGNGGNDTLTAGSLDDALFGGEGDDTLIGNAGSDVLIGGLGADTFEWKLGDEGTTNAPAEDVVLDFSTAEGDSLDLSDLLRVDGEDNITDYLHAESDGTDTVIHISQSGGFEGDYATHTSATDQVITLEGVDLSGQGSSDQIIQYLIDGNHLSID